MYLPGGSLFNSSQIRHKEIWTLKLNLALNIKVISHPHPTKIGTLTTVVCTSGPNLVVLA